MKKAESVYRNCWGFRYGGQVVISERKYRLEARPEMNERDYFGSPAARIEYLPAAAVESLVEDAGCAYVDLDAT